MFDIFRRQEGINRKIDGDVHRNTDRLAFELGDSLGHQADVEVVADGRDVA